MLPKDDIMMPRARILDMNPEIWNGLSETSKRTLNIHGARILDTYFFFIKRMCYCVYHKDQWQEAEKSLLNNFLRGSYFPKVWRLHKEYGDKAEKLAKKYLANLAKLTKSEMLIALHKIRKAWIEFDETNTLAWFIGSEPLKGYLSEKLIAKYKLNFEQIEILCNADEFSLAAEEEIEVHKATLHYQRVRNFYDGSAARLSNNYGWIPYGYDGTIFWDEKYYRDKIKKLSKISKKKLVEKC